MKPSRALEAAARVAKFVRILWTTERDFYHTYLHCVIFYRINIDLLGWATWIFYLFPVIKSS